MTKNAIEIREKHLKQKLNRDIEVFPQVFPITDDMIQSYDGIQRLVMLDRYAFKDTEHKTTGVGDLVVLTVKEDPVYPARGIGVIQHIDDDQKATIYVEEAYRGSMDEGKGKETGLLTVNLNQVDKPLELFYEQIAKRNAKGLSDVETNQVKRRQLNKTFYDELKNQNLVPAGRILYGAGSGNNATFFNCYVLPFIHDSREGIANHRETVMKIMSMGGGVGTNASTLRPRNMIARGVSGKSSGSVSWLNDIASLTHLVSQGGNRRGAQMGMIADWHPDVIEFIISKMQNPRLLRYIIEQTNDPLIKELSKEKLKFTLLSPKEKSMYQSIVNHSESFESDVVREAKQKLNDGGTYTVHNPDFLSGANISVTLTNDFMEAVEKDSWWHLRYPDLERYDEDQMRIYNEKWSDIGDVKEWESLGFPVKTFKKIKARELWNLITSCATYAAEPGIFFIDNANDKTNAKAYGQKVVGTNPCLTGDMKLLTKDGYKTFEELSGQEVDIVNHLGKITKGKVWKTGNKETVSIKLSNKKVIRSTEDHRFMTINGEEKEAKDLTGEQLMPYLNNTNDFDKKFVKFGFIQGDGNLTRLKSERHLGLEINFGKKDEDVRKYFGLSGSERKEYVTEYNSDLLRLKFKKETLENRSLPETYHSWSEMEKKSFLKGLFSANGSMLTTRISFKTTCKELVLELKESLMTDFNIDSYITTNKPKEVEFSNGTYLCKENYDLNIGRHTEMNKFFNSIGFIHKYKMSRLKERLINKAPYVTSVKKTGLVEEVYDFNEPETHWGVVEGVITHNCGEQPLSGFSVCNLSAINLAKMVNKETKEVDFDKLSNSVREGVRMQDNVIDATVYFLEENKKQALGERRIGLGVMGLADMLIYAEKRYGSSEGNALINKVFETIACTAYEESIEIAKEKGSFGFLIGENNAETMRLREAFINTGYMKTMPEHIREGVLKYGIRNSHLLTVAPTGSTGTMIGVATGLEPYFAFEYYRSGRLGKFIKVRADIVQEYLDKHPEADPENLPEWFVSAMDLTPEEHVDVQSTIQRWVDSSISKTVNAPKGTTPKDVSIIYERLYKGGNKGGTVYVDGSRDSQVLTLKAEENSFDEDSKDKESPSEETKADLDKDNSVGVELGDTCPVCRKGTVEDIGGCHTCSNCNTQLKCGL